MRKTFLRYCPFTDADIKFDCDVGFTSAGNRQSCVKCPPGFYCADSVNENGYETY